MRFPDDTTEVDYDRLAHKGEVDQLNAEDAEDAAHEGHDPQVDAERLDCDLCRDDATQTPYTSLTDADPATWTAYRLSDEAGVQSPDNRESPGALFLLAVRDAAVSYYDEDPDERREAGDDEWWHDPTHHLADEAIPLPTHRRWQVFTDLCLWSDESVLDIPALTRDVSAGRGEEVDMTAQATAIIYEVAHRLTWIILTELTNNDAEVTA
tara:strand:+ start:818 stop:1447 length:630 start_codon:yes stop_codon:yes gene_type:complete